jgi:DNA-directed RNA polymerase subunit RPC12/RpoP
MIPAFDLVNGRPVSATIYTRCPACGVVAAAGSLDYALTGPDGAMDQERPVEIGCSLAGHHYTAHVEDFLARDAVRTCSRARCAHTFAVPAVADEVVCPQCRLHQAGPFSAVDDERTAYVAGVFTEFADNARGAHPPGQGRTGAARPAW